MSSPRVLDCLRLIRSQGIGSMTYHRLVREKGSEKKALHFLTQQGRSVISEKEALSEIKRHGDCKAHLITYDDNDYPTLLRSLPDAPPVLSVLGNRCALHTPMIAIVGSRNASVNALKFTHALSRDLSEMGYTVVSGLARGIDGAAHKGALSQCSLAQCTLAVMAGGVDRLYPPEHASLREAILQNGALISEMPLGLFPGASHFPRRNRIISGLVKAICIVEASKPSGSLITAQYALDQGRELFCVPGFPGDPRSVGTNFLIKQGAYVLESAADIMAVLGSPSIPHNTFTPAHRGHTALTEEKGVPKFLDHDARSSYTPVSTTLMDTIMTTLNQHPLSLDEICAATSDDRTLVHTALLHLELEGKVQRDGRGYVMRVF